MGLIFTEQTRLAEDVHPALAFIVLIIGVLWLTMVEGGQGAIVGLGPVQLDLYKDSHPWSYRCTSLCLRGDNLDRYLLGRQYMVILIVFSVHMAGEAVENAELWGFPDWLTNMFLASGVAMVLFTNMVGQLNSEINACHCMLDYRKYCLFIGVLAFANCFVGPTPLSLISNSIFLFTFFAQSTTGLRSSPSTSHLPSNFQDSCIPRTWYSSSLPGLLVNQSCPKRNGVQFHRLSFSGADVLFPWPVLHLPWLSP